MRRCGEPRRKAHRIFQQKIECCSEELSYNWKGTLNIEWRHYKSSSICCWGIKLQFTPITRIWRIPIWSIHAIAYFSNGSYWKSMISNNVSVPVDQVNGIKEHMHLIMVNMIRMMAIKVDDTKVVTWKMEVDAMLQAVAWAIRSTVNEGMKYAPTNLLYNKDMILNKDVEVNWTAIRNHCEAKHKWIIIGKIPVEKITRTSQERSAGSWKINMSTIANWARLPKDHLIFYD